MDVARLMSVGIAFCICSGQGPHPLAWAKKWSSQIRNLRILFGLGFTIRGEPWILASPHQRWFTVVSNKCFTDQQRCSTWLNHESSQKRSSCLLSISRKNVPKGLKLPILWGYTKLTKTLMWALYMLAALITPLKCYVGGRFATNWKLFMEHHILASIFNSMPFILFIASPLMDIKYKVTW